MNKKFNNHNEWLFSKEEIKKLIETAKIINNNFLKIQTTAERTGEALKILSQKLREE